MSISAPSRTSSKRVDPQPRPLAAWTALAQRTLTLLGLGVFCCACAPHPFGAGRTDLTFVGDSITAAGPWQTAFPNRKVVNAGVPGYTTVDLLAHGPRSSRDQPHTYVLMAGINDLRRGARPEAVAERLALIRGGLAGPGQRVIQVSTLPCQVRRCGAAALRDVETLNRLLRRQVPAADFLDLSAAFSDPQGLRSDWTSDGLHLNAAGYEQWLQRLRPLLDD